MKLVRGTSVPPVQTSQLRQRRQQHMQSLARLFPRCLFWVFSNPIGLFPSESTAATTTTLEKACMLHEEMAHTCCSATALPCRLMAALGIRGSPVRQCQLAVVDLRQQFFRARLFGYSSSGGRSAGNMAKLKFNNNLLRWLGSPPASQRSRE